MLGIFRSSKKRPRSLKRSRPAVNDIDPAEGVFGRGDLTPLRPVP